MRLIFSCEYPGWRLRSPNEKRGRNFHQIKRWDRPPLPMRTIYADPDKLVTEPHPQRLVRIIRVGPREMDEDNLWAAVKPALDRLKVRLPNGMMEQNWIYDDSPRFCRTEPVQEKGDFSCKIEVYEQGV